MHSRQIVIAAAVCMAMAADAWAGSMPNAHEDQYFKGVEDRLKQADAVVFGKARIIEHSSVAGSSSDATVKARIHVSDVLKGEPTLQSIDYTSVYRPKGYATFTGGADYWGTEDEKHSRLVECFPYNLSRSAVFFLKKKADREWHPFYAYLDDDEHTMKRAVQRIITTEKDLAEGVPDVTFSQLLSTQHPPVVRKYAIRAILRHNSKWSNRAEAILLSADHLWDDDELYIYAVACVVAHLQHEKRQATATPGFDLVLALLGNAPNNHALNNAVRETGRISAMYRENQEEARTLRNTLLSTRSVLAGQPADIGVLSEEDKEFLAAIGQPVLE